MIRRFTACAQCAVCRDEEPVVVCTDHGKKEAGHFLQVINRDKGFTVDFGYLACLYGALAILRLLENIWCLGFQVMDVV